MIATMTLIAAVAAAPVQLDLDALKAGQLPAAGTMAEADACAAETTFMAMGFAGSERMTAEQKKTRLNYPMTAWTARAAALRGTTPVAYMNDDAVVSATISLAGLPTDSHFSLHTQCRQRLNPAQ